MANPQIVPSKASDHYPVTCDFSSGRSFAQSTKLPIISRGAQTVTVSYLDQPQVIPITATDLK